MFHLPKNVIQLIFSFDNTYYNFYKNQIVPHIFCKTCMICECYKPSSWYFEINYNNSLIKEMLVCGTCLVYNNKRIKTIHEKLQSYCPILGIYSFMADLYNLRNIKECYLNYYGPENDDDMYIDIIDYKEGLLVEKYLFEP